VAAGEVIVNARRLTGIAWGVCAVSAVGTLVLLAVGLGKSTPGDTFVVGGWGGFSFAFASMAFATMGALIGARLPDNRVGWVFCMTGLALGLGTVTYHYADQVLYGSAKGLPGGTVAALLQNFGVPPTFGLLALALMLFPDGHLPSRRWWPAVVPSLAGAAFVVIGYGLRPGPYDVPFETEVNPLGVGGAFVFMDSLTNFGWPLMGFGLLLAAAAMRARLKRAQGLERQQLRWVTLAAAVAGVMILADIASFFLDIGESNQLRIAALGIGFSVVPIAAGVAILRYRLYDIDVVINRALVYGALTAMLAGTYLGSVLLLQLALRTFTEGSGLAVAASTLATAALFRPLRARTQAVVDRRFFRRKYNSTQTIEEFGARLRDEVNLESLTTDLRNVVTETMQPAHITLWVKGPKP